LEWLTYSVRDFIPFTQEIYLRLIERINAAAFPWVILLVLLPLAITGLALRRKLRLATALLSLTWLWCGFSFFNHYYIQLNWAAGTMAWAFYTQALLLDVLCCSSSTVLDLKHRIKDPSLIPGWLLLLAGLLWPIITLLLRGSLKLMEFIALHPDATTVFTLGFVLLFSDGWRRIILVSLPLLWALASALTLGVIQLQQHYLLYALIVIALLGVVLPFKTDKQQ